MLLYLRQFFTLGVSLYISRLTLEVLGISDFGIYAAVGGITAIISVFTSSMSTSTQRFMTFEMGTGNTVKLRNVYITSLQIHLLLCVIFFLITETIGLWFVKNEMNIPIERIDIAIYVFHFSVLVSMLNLINIPFFSAIIAHEDMATFAFFSIAEAALKLGVVLLLNLVTWDKLFGYAVFLFFIQCLLKLVSFFYCRFKYSEIKYRYIFDRKLAKEMFSLAGWSLMSNISVLGFIQGVNILLNIFFGPILNAAYSVAMQAYSGIRSFTSSFQLAANPQIIKSYSKGDFKRLHSLIITVCKTSFFLIFFISLPFIINAEEILTLWLGQVPEHSTSFFVLLLLYSYFDVFAYPLDVAAQATGNLMRYSTFVSLATLGILPISYFLYLNGAVPEIVYVVAILMSILGLIVRVINLTNLINLPFKLFAKEVLIKAILIGCLSCVLPLLINFFFQKGGLRIFFSFFTSFISSALFIYVLGLTKIERVVLKDYSISFCKRFKII